MRRRDDEFELTIVYESAEAGWLTASIPALPGTISACGFELPHPHQRTTLESLGQVLHHHP